MSEINDDKKYDLIVVGAGPGGIAAAVEASIANLGSILILEKGSTHSQTIREYYKEAKRVDKDWKGQEAELLGNVPFDDGTKESTLEYFDTLLQNESIEVLYNCEVDRVLKDGDEFTVVAACGNYKTSNVVVSIGRMGKPNKPSYKISRKIKKQVNFNTYDCKGNETVLVVGGGDSAVEYACELTDNNDVTLAYRRDKFVRINDINAEIVERYAKEGKLNLRLGTDIESIEPDDGKIKVNYKGDSSSTYDRVIYALGGTTPVDFFRKSGMDLEETDIPKTNEHFETTVNGMYIAGDINFESGGTIIIAFNHAYEIVKDIIAKA